MITKDRPEHISTGRRIPELDGLRGVAILLVIFFHYVNNQLLDKTDSISRNLSFITGFGWVGVDLFFVLSGFLIGTILILHRTSKNYFKTFYLRRVARIVPNYFLLLVVFGVILIIPYFNNNHFLTGSNNIPLWSYFAIIHNIFMAARHSLGNDSISVTWSIGIEEQFYLFFPFIVFFINERFIPWILSLLIVVALAIRSQFDHWIPQYVLLPCRMDSLSIGFLIAYFHQKGLFEKHKKFISGFLTIAMIVDVFVCAFLYWRYKDLGIAKHSLFAIFFGGLVIFALTHKNSILGFLLRNRLLIWIGTISYSLYLFHYLILGLVHQFAGNVSIGISNWTDVLLSFFSLLLSLGFSWLIFQVLEKPFVKWGKRFQF